MRDDTLPLSHFEAIYARGDDPWHFASSAYEAAKYAATLAALPRARYARAYEVGCSLGVLTRALADRCDDLLAVEPVTTALTAARHRNADKPWVRFAEAFVPRDWPQERFDLVVLSEVLDYLGTSDLSGVGDCLRRTLDPGGDVVLVHWIGKKGGVTARPDEASEVLIGSLGDVLTPMVQRRTKDYRLDVFRRRA